MLQDLPGVIVVLVVEDEWLLREDIAECLRHAGCGVLTADSGEAAVAILTQADEIDVVVTDIRLGGSLNGWDVGEVGRAKRPDLPVIYTSGQTVDPPRPVGQSLFFDKPYDPDAIVRACLQLARAH